MKSSQSVVGLLLILTVSAAVTERRYESLLKQQNGKRMDSKSPERALNEDSLMYPSIAEKSLFENQMEVSKQFAEVKGALEDLLDEVKTKTSDLNQSISRLTQARMGKNMMMKGSRGLRALV
jgi:hypothetical protein